MQSAGMLQTMTQVYGAVKAGFTAIGDSVAFAAQDAGAWLMQHTTGALNKLGGQMMSSSGALGSAAGYGAGLAAGHYVGRAISGDYGSNATVNIATIAGAVIGGPIGAAIGGVIGGLANRAFGMGSKQMTGQGIRGTFSGDSFSGSQYATMLQKGGWFRSDRNWTETSGLDAGTQQALSQGFASIKAATASLASGLGGSALAVKLYSQQINLALTSDAEKNKEIITKLFTDMGDTLARIAVPSIDKFRRENETAAAALQRLSTDLTAVNRVLDTLGQTAFRLNVFGADAASSLVQMFGGMEALNSATSAYYEAFYGEAERLDTTARQLAQAFAAAGMTNAPQSLAEYRALIEAQDLMTEAGRQQYTMLMQLAPAFASLEKAGQAVTAASREAAQAAASEAKAKREALVAAGQRLSEWLASLRMANASAAVSLGMARADYLKNLTLARGNDATALANVSGSAETYISAARGQARSTAEFRAIVAQVSSEVGNLPAVKTYQQEQLELMREWLVAIGAVRTGLGGDIAGLTLLTSDGFTTLDTTANGLLSYDELTKGLAGIATDAQIKALISAVDLNGDGQISAIELAAAENKLLVEGLSKTVADSFTVLDTTANGLLSYDELTKGLAGIATDAQIKALISAVDLNGDGQLSELELATKAQQAIQTATEDSYLAALGQIKTLVQMNDSGLVSIANNTSNAIPYLNNIQEYLKAIKTNGTLSPTVATPVTPPQSTAKAVDLSNSLLNNSVTQSLINPLKSLKFWAGGGVFGGEGIYTQPSLFGANGNLNVMGEAGPEAVMPLERMSDGALGVRAQMYAAPMSQPERTAADPALLAELRALRAEVADLRAEARSTAVATNKTARILDRVTPDGNSLQTTAAA
jgi:Ca2+-binding EF-hand superfamily protein